jgi:catechol 2,3-dioxygenase-like lactoylglutathione lyase family enzyme
MAAPADNQKKTLHDVVLGLGHFTIPVGDMVKAFRFYTEVLGFEQAGQPRSLEEIEAAKASGQIRAPHLSVKMQNGPRLDLFEVPYQRVQFTDDHPHYAFQVAGSDLDFCAQALREAEVPFDGPSRRGPVGGASLYFLDPWGNKLEFNCHTGYEGEVEDRPPVWSDDLKYTW